MAGKYFAKERERFETRRVAEEIPLFFRMFIWLTIDEMMEDEAVKMDYLQIFDFEVIEDDSGKLVQTICHRQEQPKYEKKYSFHDVPEGIKTKLYCIDDGTAIVLTTPEER